MVTTLDQHEHHSSGGEQLVDASTINTSAASRTTPWPQSPGPTTTATAAMHNSTMDDRFSSIQSPSPSQGDTLRSLLEAEKMNGLKVGMRCASESSAVLGSQLYMGTIRYIGPIKVPSKPETGCVSRDGGSSADVGGVGGVGGGTGTGTGTGSCDDGNGQDDSDDELPELLRPSRLLSRLRVSGFDESGEPIFMGPDEELEGVEKDVEVMWVGIEFDDPVGKNNGSPSVHRASAWRCGPHPAMPRGGGGAHQ
ncbi:uncharacterized protein EI90DRAFT_821563 [Cantharellus anzutake]|uniref:uncharacterized protein n=1 Tax=Cantharellus anzutake TaxID=1750568 RepID=UPI001904F4C9|nr:uncharacterized protein EI90DRAFT_821563 [Cantharellus anzutake]KAF8343027.1 hypothetical protein EI90DRAFT_821563 [Cantharellus anzutake]